MAPSSRDDRRDADVSRTSEPEETRRQEGAPDAGKEPVDFGAFVSRSVRSTSSRLRGGGGDDHPRPERRPRPTPTVGGPRVTRRERPSRYWRDSLRERSGEELDETPTVSRRFIGGAPEEPEQDAAVGSGGGGVGDIWRRLVDGGDGDGPNRPLIAWFIAGLVVMLLLIFLLARLLGGGGDEGKPEATPTPTSTVTTIVQPGAGEESTPAADGVPAEPTEPEPTETPGIQQGGDNVLRRDRSTPVSEEPGAQRTPGVESPLAKECDDRCLVRVEADQVKEVLAETGNRPSLAVEGIAWVVATPEQVSLLDEQADVALVQPSAETLYLYVIKIPQGGDAELVRNYGDVLDETGRYRLVRVNELPARVHTLATNGFSIAKLEPAPVERAATGERGSIANADAGDLMGQVSEANIVERIQTMQAIGSNDGSGIGTRYYTTAGNQIAADSLYQTLESYGLRVWFEDFLTPDGVLLVNVVAEAPGADDSRVYAVMAHLDSINDEGSTDIAPGADDNSTGMAATLEMARILAQYELKYPVRFVFVNAEEVGIVGASAWAKRANADGVPIEGVFNIDSVGSGRQGRLMIFNSDERSFWMQELMMSVNEGYGLGQEIMSRTNPAIVADDNMVREQGIEAVMIARELYGWSPLHHSPRDVFEEVSIDNVLTTTYMVLLSVVALVTP